MSLNKNPTNIRKSGLNKGFFAGAGRAQILNETVRLLRQESPALCIVSGPEGIGKTKLLAEVRRELFPSMHAISMQGHFGSMERMLEELAKRLELNISACANSKEILDLIGHRLSCTAEGKPVLVLFDDAHALPLPVIRMLVQFFRTHGRNTRVALFVDNEAADVISSFLKQHMAPTITMRRIGRYEIEAYLIHRYGSAHPEFDEVELDTIFEASDGVPARINTQAEYVQKQRQIQTHITEQIVSVSDSGAFALPSFAGAPAGLAAAACMLMTVMALTIGTAVQQEQADYTAALEAGPAPHVELSEEQFAELDDDYEVELPEEFVEFSNQLSDDEIDILQIEPNQYVLQFMAGDSEEDMLAFIDEHNELDVKMYRSLADGQPWYKAVATGFADPETAENVIDDLPADLQKEKPWVRSVASVQQEILVMGEEHLSEPKDSLSSLESWVAWYQASSAFEHTI
ncbi:MAG: AAA family ATPase [Pseudomonadales bacterium]